MEYLQGESKEELKRADHSIYVTLKYTRTADVLKNTIKRLISALELGILEGLMYAKDKKIIKEIPDSLKSKPDLLKKVFKQQDLTPYIDLYYLLRKIDKLPYTKREEYRKHVTLIAHEDGEKIEVNVPVLTSYYKQTREFIILIENWIKGIKDD